MRLFLLLVTLLAVVALPACNKQRRQPPVDKHASLADSADQIMFGARFTMADKGVSRALLFGDTAFFFDANTRVELEDVKTTFFTTTGVKSGILTSRRGTYRTQSGLMTARGDVVVISEDGQRQLRSPELNYDQAHNQIYTDSSFVQTDSGRTLTGVGFRSDPDLKNIIILKAVSGTGGTFTIPTR